MFDFSNIQTSGTCPSADLVMRPGALYRRRIAWDRIDWYQKTSQCTYMHPVTANRCKRRCAVEIVWTADKHWKEHMVQEIEWMRQKALAIGEGSAIVSRSMFSEYSDMQLVCDVCEMMSPHRAFGFGILPQFPLSTNICTTCASRHLAMQEDQAAPKQRSDVSDETSAST